MDLVENINQESELVLNQFFDSKNKNPEPEDIRLNNKLKVHQFLREKYINNEIKLVINISRFSYNDVMEFTPVLNKIIIYILFVGVATFPFFVKPIIFIFIPLFFLFIISVVNFIVFQKKIKQAIINDFCEFESWYDNQRFSFTFNGKEYKFPDNWSNLLVKMRFDHEKTE